MFPRIALLVTLVYALQVSAMIPAAANPQMGGGATGGGAVAGGVQNPRTPNAGKPGPQQHDPGRQGDHANPQGQKGQAPPRVSTETCMNNLCMRSVEPSQPRLMPERKGPTSSRGLTRRDLDDLKKVILHAREAPVEIEAGIELKMQHHKRNPYVKNRADQTKTERALTTSTNGPTSGMPAPYSPPLLKRNADVHGSIGDDVGVLLLQRREPYAYNQAIASRGPTIGIPAPINRTPVPGSTFATSSKSLPKRDADAEGDDELDMSFQKRNDLHFNLGVNKGPPVSSTSARPLRRRSKPLSLDGGFVDGHQKRETITQDQGMGSRAQALPSPSGGGLLPF